MVNKLSLYVIACIALLMGVALTSAVVWTQDAFTHGLPDYGQGCYCHNNDISVYINGSGDGMFAITLGPFPTGSTFHIRASTSDSHTTGAVPNNQLWMSTQADNAKFNITPEGVTDNSANDLNQTAGNITAIYTATAPATAGTYLITLYAQGVLVSPVTVVVVPYNSTARFTATKTTTSTASASTSLTTSSSTGLTVSVTNQFPFNPSNLNSAKSTGNGGEGSMEFLYLVLIASTLAFFAPIIYFLVGAGYILVRHRKLS
jgi:hypothetical protein